MPGGSLFRMPSTPSARGIWQEAASTDRPVLNKTSQLVSESRRCKVISVRPLKAYGHDLEGYCQKHPDR